MKDSLRQTKYLISETDPLLVPHCQAEVVFIGRSNVGKSSAICALCDNKSLAVVSKKPGRTRGINVFEVAPERWLVDLPGYGYADAKQRARDYWPKMIGTYLGGRPNLNRVYVLLDAELGFGPLDRPMIDWLKEKNIPFRIVGSKVDRVGPSRQLHYRTMMAKSIGLEAPDIQWISAKKKTGVKELQLDVVNALGL